jgi:hypothetical protein
MPIVPVSPSQSYSDDDEKDVKLGAAHSLDEESTPLDEAAQKKLERRFLRRLDLCLITWAFCSYLMKIIDTNNYRVSFASGMKEDVSIFRPEGPGGGGSEGGELALNLSLMSCSSTCTVWSSTTSRRESQGRLL